MRVPETLCMFSCPCQPCKSGNPVKKSQLANICALRIIATALRARCSRPTCSKGWSQEAAKHYICEAHSDALTVKSGLLSGEYSMHKVDAEIAPAEVKTRKYDDHSHRVYAFLDFQVDTHSTQISRSVPDPATGGTKVEWFHQTPTSKYCRRMTLEEALENIKAVKHHHQRDHVAADAWNYIQLCRAIDEHPLPSNFEVRQHFLLKRLQTGKRPAALTDEEQTTESALTDLALGVLKNHLMSSGPPVPLMLESPDSFPSFVPTTGARVIYVLQEKDPYTAISLADAETIDTVRCASNNRRALYR
jgi:hypothetical protein